MAKKSNVIKVVGKNIRKLRKEQEKSQGQLANESDLTREFINKLEGGKVNISVTKLHQISKALDVPITDLFKLFHR